VQDGARHEGARLTRMAAYATIVGAALAAATVAISLGSGDSSHALSARAPHLQPVDLVVSDRRGDTQLEVILHNVGTGRSIVKEARFRILHVARLTLCASQGDLPLSERYNVLLPSDATPGQVITAPIHEQLASDEADRFALSLAVSGEVNIKTFKLPEHIYIFQLDLSLLRDVDSARIDLGKVLIALPTIPLVDEYFETEEHDTAAFRAARTRLFGARYLAEHESCWRANALELKRVLALPGMRSPELTDATSHLAA
jgi:hypothetical protein